MCKSTVDFLILTKNNLVELKRTLQSITICLDEACRVVIIDGGPSRVEILSLIDECNIDRSLVEYIDSHSLAIFGIYPSMNLALDYVKSDWFIFINSGDSLYSYSSFCRFRQLLSETPADLVFGQASIVPSSNYNCSPWLFPDSNVTNIDAWLKFFEPNMQAMFVRKKLSFIKFPISSPVGGDVPWKRSIASESYIYLKAPIACFYLGGASTTYSYRLLRTKLNEPSRPFFSKIMELIKFILHLCGLMSPQLLRFKSRISSIFFK